MTAGGGDPRTDRSIDPTMASATQPSRQPDDGIRVTAIVSTYQAERFMQGCLEDLLRQSIAEQMEIIVVDSCSPQDEGRIVRTFQQRHPNIVYLRTDQREGLYKAWNRAVEMARGRYLTNANTDDRHHPQSFERLAAVLDAAPQHVLAYHYQIVSDIENETFEDCLVRQPPVRRYPTFSLPDMLRGCIVGSQPMWRRSVHAEHGLFSERYRIAGDYEFWARIAQTHTFATVPEALGLFYDSPHTLSGIGSRLTVDTESLEIQLKYLAVKPWRDDPGNRKVLANYLFGVGYRYVELLKDLKSARVFLREAMRLDPTNFRYAKTYLLRGLLQSSWGMDMGDAPRAASRNKA
jgi:glycosyltransferase involved in cell wall biosynthesis